MDNINFKELISEIEIAKEKCEELNEAKKTIFITILKSLQYLIDPENIKQKKREVIQIHDVNIPEAAQRLSKATKISVDDLDLIFSIEDEKLELIATFKDKSWTQQHFKSTICLLTAYHFCFGIKEMKSPDLNEHMKKLEMGSLQNLSPNLQKPQFKKYITVEGKKGASKVYKIKGLGIKEGLKLIEKLLSQELGEEND
ncbi:hypothetical protein [Methanobacterium formicicum]|uniref:hypothetical protein n=1 Tax=Methanobacterium formicicum TaxID=2162 RepID=UPI0024129B21|nr:hypothetical protein [Methanobacterium formicicum]MDG3546624.1 hypothetical protein [Methanobacterium formicicum]